MAEASPVLTAKNHLTFWIGTFAVFLLFVWAFGDMLLPFVLGGAIAYLLDPLVEWLGRRKVPRWLAALAIVGLFVIFVLSLLVITIPLLYRQIAQLAETAPGYIDQLSEMLSPYIAQIQAHTGDGERTTLQEALQNNIGNVLDMSAGVLGKLASGGQAFAGFMTLVVLTPIVSFFLLKEWTYMSKWIDNLLPRGSYTTVKRLLGEIDHKLSGFVRGQITVAFLLGVIYAAALTVARLDFGFLIGLLAGVLSIVPLVGSTVGLLAGTIVAWLQSGDWSYVGVIAAIFIVGQIIEGNIIAPKVLGKSVGLHPLWILFALLAGGSAFGLVGVLLAVPVAAVIGVLGSFVLTKYRESPYYQDGRAPRKKKS